MRLVWVVIPLVLIGIIGIQESFSERQDGYICSTKKINQLFHGMVNGEPIVEEREVEVEFCTAPPSEMQKVGCNMPSYGPIQWHERFQNDSKIMPDLQKNIDRTVSGNLCITIVLPHIQWNTEGVHGEYDLETEYIKRMYLAKEKISNQLNEYDVYISSHSGVTFPSSEIHATVPKSIISQIKEMDDVKSVGEAFRNYQRNDTDPYSDVIIDVSPPNRTTEIIKEWEEQGFTYKSNLELGQEQSFEIVSIQQKIIRILEENNATIGKINDNYIEVSVPKSLIPKLESLDEVILLDVYGRIPVIGLTLSGYTITSALQAKIDSGLFEIVDTRIELVPLKKWPHEKYNMQKHSPEEQDILRQEETDRALKIQEPVKNFLDENISHDIKYSKYPHQENNWIFADIPVNLINELKEIENILYLDVSQHGVITSMDQSGGDEAYSMPIEFLPRMTNENNFSVVYDDNLPPISPLKQIKLGISHSKITCNEGLELIFKPNDSPACVKPETAEKLIERGWALEISSIDSFEECVAAGNSVLNEQDEEGGWWQHCYTPDGKKFIVDCNRFPHRCV